jgi:NAD(P)-dependent dehydrogenase (short-subunit alcohol dehydrogenase family)
MTNSYEPALGRPASGVIVTGGASGIGAAVSSALAAVGRPVAVWDLDGSAAAEVASECATGQGVASHSAGIDVTDDRAVAAAIEPAAEALGTIGGVVHAAGIVRPALTDVIDLDTWDDVVRVHLRAYAFVVNALLPELRAAGSGAAVVGIASIEGLIGHGAIPSYTAAKTGMIGLTRALSHRLGPTGVRVNCVCPGYIETPMLAPTIADAGVRAAFEAQVPLGRVGAPGEIARVVRFLLSDEASYMNGSAVVIDGGVTACGGQQSNWEA